MDPKTGKATTQPVLEDKKKPPSKLSHAVRMLREMRRWGNSIRNWVNRTGQCGLESAHKSEEAVEPVRGWSGKATAVTS